MNKLEKQLSREIRGYILKMLDINYPYPSSDHLIAEILTDAQYICSPAQVKVHLAYLAEKGYIELDTVSVEELGTRCLAKLTVKGKDLLEGSIAADPGVTVNG
ncbi:hypothetical protein [Anaeromusa acidaminophila]|uniref:hypothetical protein n=1 Tax=Anaeromusa acidaminophila TaxID=81464 RepID=UPI000368AE01|nr:hypothetical protein [Anaeromusa acidaminophila]